MNDKLNVSLPKWPQMIVRGERVTVEQAKEIIFRTDSFVNGGYASGNNHRWVANARSILGFDIFDDRSYFDANPKYDWRSMWEVQRLVREELQVLETEYVHNTWASSSFIYGPYGWCHPDGTIAYWDNVGKWPNAEEIYGEWVAIAEAFPFLSITITLMSGERCEEDTEPVITFEVKNGVVEIADKPYVIIPETKERGFISMRHDGAEQGLPDSWIDEYSVRTRPVVEKHKHLLQPYKEPK